MGQICDAIRQEGIKIGESRGLAQGIEIGEANGINGVITTMLESGYEIEEISKITKKTKEYIFSIKNKLK